jgi:hypothetical protein
MNQLRLYMSEVKSNHQTYLNLLNFISWFLIFTHELIKTIISILTQLFFGLVIKFPHVKNHFNLKFIFLYIVYKFIILLFFDHLFID